MNSGGFSPRISAAPALAERLGSETHVVIIGAGGWLSRAMLDLLAGVFGGDLERRVSLFGSSARLLSVAPGVELPVRTLAEADDAERPTADRLILMHNAFLTRDKVGTVSATQYLESNRAIADAVAGLVRRWRPQGVFLPSSGAVYGADGLIESDPETNPYGWLKARDEALFGEITEACGAHLIAPRIFALSGEYINKLDTYVIASVIRQLLSDRAVTLRATRPVYRSYTYVGDLLNLSLALLASSARRQEVFDTGGSDVIEIEDLARLARTVLGREHIAIERTLEPGATPDRYVGNTRRMQQLYTDRGLSPLSLEEQILRTAAYISDATC